MHGKIWTVLAAGTITLLALAGLAASPASATTHHLAPAGGAAALRLHIPGHAPVRSRTGAPLHGIGFGGHLAPGVSTATVFQCPEYFCNQGTDYAGNDIAGICTWQNVSPSGQQWNWTFTLDHADNVIGFIPSSEFVSSVGLKTCPAGASWLEHLSSAEGVWQCPESFCNKGTDYVGNLVFTFCNATQDSGTWHLALDFNDGVVGFVPGDNPNVPTC